ncbi:MAG: hypothetical protein QF578_03390 [Alphaproteobacteria bacterium]|jgi:hypothetical protein|nr:hypothetical protein [Alphaproteobacteria bacterium]MDP6814429.1 hypothetical protein [Alphaproteobacteria bacterium]
MTDKHWLERPRTIAWLWRIGWAVLALLVLAEFSYHPHPYFTVDGWFGFHAGFGFLACVAMVLLAKLLGVYLKRDEDYYHRD